GEPDSSFGYGLNYNPLDPYNMYPHHETGEEVYGPPPMFGINKHDPFNMKPFNPNMFGGLAAAPAAIAPVAPVGPALNTIGPNPFTPLLQPTTPVIPMAPATDHVAPMAGPMMPPMGGMNPLLMAATLSTLSGDSSFATGSNPSSSSNAGADPSSSYYMNPYNPYFLDPFAMHVATPQNPHPTDPNNQYPHPMTGSLTQPGPALAGGYNAYDLQNLIGAPPVFSERERAMEHNRAAMQAQSPYAPYRMHQVPVPPPP
ncbi:unnamed protein product, partial [Sphacelaria rigidula]